MYLSARALPQLYDSPSSQLHLLLLVLYSGARREREAHSRSTCRIVGSRPVWSHVHHCCAIPTNAWISILFSTGASLLGSRAADCDALFTLPHSRGNHFQDRKGNALASTLPPLTQLSLRLASRDYAAVLGSIRNRTRNDPAAARARRRARATWNTTSAPRKTSSWASAT